MYLRQSTSQVILLGPFLDITDGVTEETALTLANTDVRLSKDGGAFAAKNSGGLTHDSDGWYSGTLDATDTATVGELVVNVHQPANTLPVWKTYWVLEEAVYDDLFGASAAGIPTVAEIQSGLATAAALTTVDNEIATIDANVDLILVDTGTTLQGELDGIQADTEDLQTQIGTAGAGLTAVPWNAAWDAEVQSEVNDALVALGLDHLVGAAVTGTDVVDNSIIAQLVSSQATADWDDYVNTTDALQALRDRGDAAWVTGAGGTPPQLLQETTIATLASQTSFTLTAGSADDDAYNDQICVIEDSATTVQKAVGIISDYTGVSKTVTLSADPAVFTMAVGDTIRIIASAAAGTAPTAAAVADAVWDEDIIAAHTTADTAGAILGTSIPASISGIGAASGGALNYEADDDNVGGAIKTITFVGVETTNTFAATETANGVYHVIDDTANAIDIVYQFPIGGSRTAVEVTFRGYVSGFNDVVTVQAYDYVGTDWETIGTIQGQAGTSNITNVYSLLSKHTGTTGADIGTVLIRLVCTGQSNPTLNIDQLTVSAVNIGQSVGYTGGFIYFDSGASNTNTESFVDGVADNPVSTWAAVKTIAAATGLTRVDVTGTLTLDSTAEGIQTIVGQRAILALGGQDIGDCEFSNFKAVSGTGTVSNGARSVFDNSYINTATLPPTLFRGCGFTATMTAGSAGQWSFENCRSAVDGTASPIFDFNSTDNNNIGFTRYARGITVSGLAANDTMTVNGVMNSVVLNGISATVNISGQYGTLTDNLTGSPTVTVTNSFDVGDVADILTDTGTTLPATLTTIEGKIDTIDTNVDAVLVDTGTTIPGTITTIDTNVDAILVDTGTTLPAQIISEIDAVQADIAALENVSAAEVNAQVVDVIRTDTVAELAGVPAATSTLADKINWLFMLARNQLEQTSSTATLRADDTTTAVATAAVSDDATTAQRNEWA